MHRRLIFYVATFFLMALAGIGWMRARAPVEDADFRLQVSRLGSPGAQGADGSAAGILANIDRPLTLASSLPIPTDIRLFGRELVSGELFGGPGAAAQAAARILISGEVATEGSSAGALWNEQELTGLNLPMGLRSLILRGRSEAALSFLDRLEPNTARRYLGYRAWASFEQNGELNVAERAAIDVAEPELLPAPMARLAQAMDWHNRGADVLIQDRSGHPLGALSLTVGELDFEPTAEAEALGIQSWLPDFLFEAAPTVLGEADDQQHKALRSTIDFGLSRRLQATFNGIRGTIVILDVDTGAVLAAVSDPKTASEGGRTFFEDAREPASIAKLMTAVAVLRAGYDLDERVRAAPCHGAVNTAQGPLWCPSVLGRVDTFKRALAASCNTTFGRLGLELGQEAMLEEYSRFGFQRQSPLPVLSSLQPRAEPGTELTRERRPGAKLRQRYFSDLDLARLSVGLDHAELTPLFAARYARIFADGKLVEPKWLEGEGDWLGLAPTRWVDDVEITSPPASQVLDPDWLPILQEAMIAVSGPRGTASSAVPRTLPTAMKTGTASEPAYGFHVNYVGIAPMPTPKYAFALRVDHQRTSRRVRRAAKSVTRRMLTVLEDELRRSDSAIRLTSTAP